VARDLLRFEREARKQGAARICGIDEVGCGPLAGPVVAAAVVLPEDFRHKVLNDSKQLTELQRESLFQELTSNSGVQWAVTFIEVEEIDRINIRQAAWRAMVLSRDQLNPAPDWTLVDGLRVSVLGIKQTAIVKGDAKSLSIAAASVIAKVLRDRKMVELDRTYPGYGFADHKGYSTRVHLEALSKLGPCPIHRRSFEPVRLALNREFIFDGNALT
jgi:ribonuclease HII